MKQQNKNFIFNVCYQLVMYLFPLITAAYIARVLGAEQLGTYSYVNSIVTIVGMFCLLGISNYGNREIAKIRDDKKRLADTFSSIYSLQLVLSIIVFSIYIICVSLIKTDYKVLFLIQTMHLFSVAFDVSWLYFGLEKFKVTLTRNFIVKCISMALIVAFVKGPQDIYVYTLIMVLSGFGSQLFLFLLSRKYVRFHLCSWKEISGHLKPCLILFIPVLAYSIYRIMDKTMIGMLSTKTELAFYENAERLINIPIMVISALGTVMLPHMAHSIHNNGNEYKKTIRESMHLATIIATFSTFGLIMVGKDLSIVLYGREFEASGYLVGFLSVTVIASAWANVVRTQYLIPKSRDKIYVSSTIVGALINLVFNIMLIGSFGATGACVGTILAEFSIAIYQTASIYKELEFKEYFWDLIVNVIKALVMAVFLLIIGKLINNIYLRLILDIVIGVCVFIMLDYKYIFTEFLNVKISRKVK